MANVAVLVPSEEMMIQARQLLEGRRHIDLMCSEAVSGHSVITRAQELERLGCDLILARGAQAMLIRHSVRCPVVEIRVSVIELGAVIKQACIDYPDRVPRIAVIGSCSILPDGGGLWELGALLNADVRFYSYDSVEQQDELARRAVAEGSELLIGGAHVCSVAERLGVPSRRIPSSGRRSMMEAVVSACQLAYAIDLEKQKLAEISAMLENSFQGILQTDCEGRICRVNTLMSEWLNSTPELLLGRSVCDLVPDVDRAALDSVLIGGEEVYSRVVEIQKLLLAVNIAPIRQGPRILGAIFMFHEAAQIRGMEHRIRAEVQQHRTVIGITFDELVCVSEAMRSVVKRAKKMAHYSAPILICGEPGCEAELLACCIHNFSGRRAAGFFSVDCSAYSAHELDELLFGRSGSGDLFSGMAELAEGGTLFLEHAELLPVLVQYKLERLIRGKLCGDSPQAVRDANVRVIVSSQNDLSGLLKSGNFRYDLFNTLHVLTLELPPLRKRRDDILPWVEFYRERLQQKYGRNIRLLQSAAAALREYDWEGNQAQVFHVCEQMVLLSERRTIDEAFVRGLLGSGVCAASFEQNGVPCDPAALRVADALHRHGGNRQETAAELGISKATLWRWMKKYGLAGQ